MGFPFLSSTTTELFVIDLVAQHDPQSDPKLASGCDPGLPHSFLDQLAAIKALEIGILVDGMHGRFTPQVPQQRVALLAQPAEALSRAAGVFTRNHPDVARHCLAMREAPRITQEYLGRQSRHRSYAWMG